MTPIDKLKAEAEQLIQDHCRYCGREQEEGSRCRHDIELGKKDVADIITKAHNQAIKRAQEVAQEWHPDEEFYDKLGHDAEPVEEAGWAISAVLEKELL